MTERSLRAKLIGLLGGRAAEELVFGEASTGAQNDLQHATEMARAMVVDYGLSTAVGPLSMTSEHRGGFLPDGRIGRDTGDALLDLIDQEIKRIVVEARDAATELLSNHRKSLDKIAKLLLETEQLEGEELRALFAEVAAGTTEPETDSEGADQSGPELG